MKHEDHEPRFHHDDCDDCRVEAEKTRQFFDELEIPYVHSTNPAGNKAISIKINGYKLYDILTDEEKMKILVSKLKLKAFW